jgi:hypothetical protein
VFLRHTINGIPNGMLTEFIPPRQLGLRIAVSSAARIGRVHDCTVRATCTECRELGELGELGIRLEESCRTRLKQQKQHEIWTSINCPKSGHPLIVRCLVDVLICRYLSPTSASSDSCPASIQLRITI